MRPLYRGAEPALAAGGHRGLWYDKFCDRWDGESWSMKAGPDGGGDSPKLAWIRGVTGPAGCDEELTAYARRLLDLIDARGGKELVVKARSRFVTGLGRSHPVENGFAWHPTLGTPYLPGSSVKGLTRAWAVENGKDEEEVARLLGDPGRVGAVAILDAVPLGPVTLEADVLTPHYANWDRVDVPGDWRSPTPIPFLVAAPGWSMLCGIIPLRVRRDGDPTLDGDVTGGGDATAHRATVTDHEMATVRGWFASALDEVGAGAKTAVGYGQFEEAQHPEVDRWRNERREREAKATPEGRWRLRLAGLNEEELLGEVREHLIKNPLQNPDERWAFVRVVLDAGMVGTWKGGGRTDPRTSTGEKKRKERAAAVLACAVEFGLDVSP